METIVNPDVLLWAQDFSSRDARQIEDRFSKWGDWISKKASPTVGEIKAISDFTRIPFGYFFLPKPPKIELPIEDFRVGRGRKLEPSADLLDTVHLNQHRQDWYVDYLQERVGLEKLPFIGSAKNLGVEAAASVITEQLDFGVRRRASLGTMDEVRAYLIRRFEQLGGLAVINSLVGNNTHRKLDIDEFRGFTLHSEYAPLVFVNGSDTKNGQVFSLLHEFAHVWRGEGGVSAGGEAFQMRGSENERWCDQVAAQIAVPKSDLRDVFRPDEEFSAQLDRLGGRYKCSTLVVLIQMRETGIIGEADFCRLYDAEVGRLRKFIDAKRPGGGNFYAVQNLHVGNALGRALVNETQRGATAMTEALGLLSFSKTTTFDSYAKHLGAD